MQIVLDSNILISALIKNSFTRKIILLSDSDFLIPEYSFIEIKNHEKEILKKSKLSKEDFYQLMINLTKYLRIIKNSDILVHKKEAKEIMEKIDKKDVIFIATALAYPRSIIWSDDKHFKMQNRINVYNTKEIIDLLFS